MIQYCTCPAGRVTYNFHSSCKHMHLSFKSICNKEHKGVICNKEHKGEVCNMTSLSNSSQNTRPRPVRPTGRVLGKNYPSFLDFTRNYKQTSGIFVLWIICAGNRSCLLGLSHLVKVRSFICCFTVGRKDFIPGIRVNYF